MDRIIDDDDDLDERVVAAVRRRDDVAAAAGQRRATPPLLGECILRVYVAHFYVTFFSLLPKKKKMHTDAATERSSCVCSYSRDRAVSRAFSSELFMYTPHPTQDLTCARSFVFAALSYESDKSLLSKKTS